LKQLLISVGGENNSFQPNGTSAAQLATTFIAFMNQFMATGIDFDLENLGVTDATAYGQYLRDFIT
jgi:chitinase